MAVDSIVALIQECIQKRSKDDKDADVIICMEKVCEGYDCATMVQTIISAISAVQDTKGILQPRTVVRVLAEVWAHHMFTTEDLVQFKDGAIRVEGDDTLRSNTAMWITKVARKEKESKEKESQEQGFKEKEAKSISFCLNKQCCVTRIQTPGPFFATPSLEVGDIIYRFESYVVYRKTVPQVLQELKSETCPKIYKVIVQRNPGGAQAPISTRPVFHHMDLERIREHNVASDWGSGWGASSEDEAGDLIGDESESVGGGTFHDKAANKAATEGVSHSNAVCGMSIYRI